jgi:hypothetical protein
MNNRLLVKKIELDTLIHHSAMEPQSVHITNARVTLLWHLTYPMYLGQLEVGMTVEELKLFQQLSAMITERVEKELERQ